MYNNFCQKNSERVNDSALNKLKKVVLVKLAKTFNELHTGSNNLLKNAGLNPATLTSEQLGNQAT